MILYVPTTHEGKSTIKLSSKTAKFRMTVSYREKYDCKRSNHIERIESDGYVRYRVDCKVRWKKAKFSMDAKLAEPAPEWAKTDPPRWLYLAGTITKSGPKWKLENARIVDLRFMR